MNRPYRSDLPTPDADALAHSERLQALIRNEIEAAGGRISFARFMELALYAPGLGYYSAGSRKFGAGGDFVTAPEISALFSRCLARQSAQVLAALGGGEILEFGAGSGAMAADILRELEALDTLPTRYTILDVSGDLRARQRETLERRMPHLLERVTWLDALPRTFTGVILANEVLDAMPVHRVRFGADGKDRECCIGSEDGRFVWLEGEVGGVLDTKVETLRSVFGDDLPGDYETEINLAADAWVNSIGETLQRGAVFVIDYGFPRHEYYHPQRGQGTLMCHYRHRAHGDPLILPGLQDITAHVDFTAVAEAADAAGLSVAGFTSQANFLFAAGLESLLTQLDPQDTQACYTAAQEVKTLTLPGEMGELFKVMALTRELDTDLMGFAFQDRRGRL